VREFPGLNRLVLAFVFIMIAHPILREIRALVSAFGGQIEEVVSRVQSKLIDRAVLKTFSLSPAPVCAQRAIPILKRPCDFSCPGPSLI
jgi:hypothetical protein